MADGGSGPVAAAEGSILGIAIVGAESTGAGAVPRLVTQFFGGRFAISSPNAAGSRVGDGRKPYSSAEPSVFALPEPRESCCVNRWRREPRMWTGNRFLPPR